MPKPTSQWLKSTRSRSVDRTGGFSIRARVGTRVRRHARGAVLLIFGLALTAGIGANLARPVQTAAATDNTVNFQARLETNTGAVVPDGTYNIEFKLYDASSSSGSSQGSCSGDVHCLWTEKYQNNVAQGVQVVDGYLSVPLGSITGFPGTINWDQNLYLTMNVGGTGSSATPTYDGEMTPRLALTGVPYAFRAGSLALLTGANTSTLGWATQTAANSLLLPNEGGTLCVQGSTNCNFAPTSGSGNYIQNQTASPQAAGFNINGTGTAATFNATTGINTGSSGGTQRIDSVGNLTNIVTISAGVTSTAISGTNLDTTLTLTASPASAPAAQTDFIGIRSTTSSASANANSNTRLFGASTNSSFTGSGTLGTSYGNFMQSSNAGSGTITTALGGNGVILNSSNGIITTGTALQGTINSTGTGTITQARALDANVINNGGGTITSSYGLKVETPTNTGVGSTIGTDTGIYIGEQSAGSTNYGLYFAGTAGTPIDGISWNADTNLYRSAAATLKTDNSLVVGTLGNTGTTILCENAGLLATCASSIGSGSYIFNQTTTQANANFNIQSASASSVAAVIQGASSQSADLLDLKTSTPATVLSVSATGAALFENSADSTTALQVQNHLGTPVLTVDTSNSLTTLRGSLDNATIGPELLTGNCTGTNWSGTGSGPYTHASGSSVALTCTITGGVTVGATYQITYSATPSSGTTTVTPAIGGYIGATTTGTVTSVPQTYVTTTTANPTFTLSPSTDTGTISGISIKLITNSKPVLSVQNSSGTDQLDVRATANVTAVGFQALQSNTSSGTGNTAVGSLALMSNTTGASNTAVGNEALWTNTTGAGNTALGLEALADNATGNFNTAVGAFALILSVTSSRNTAIGNSALSVDTTGGSNTALGVSALASNTTANNNTAVGDSALSNTTTGGNNSALGFQALKFNTTGIDNVAQGYQALQDNTTANNNVAVGYQALQTNTTGSGSTALGYQALSANTTGVQNTALGNNSLLYNTSVVATLGSITPGSGYTNGTYNNVTMTDVSGPMATAPVANITVAGGVVTSVVLVSGGAGVDTTTVLSAAAASIGGTGSGFQVPVATVTGGTGNIAVGYQAGVTATSANANTTGSHNVFIGFNSGPGSATQLQNATAIGTYSVVNQSNSLILGCINGTNGCTSSTNVGIGTSTPGQTLTVEGTGLFQSVSNSTSAFQIQDASANTLINVDSLNRQITLGVTGTSPVSMTTSGVNGSYASTPDSVANSVTGDIDLIAKIAPVDWSPSTTQEIIAKDNSTTTQTSYEFFINNTNGQLKLGLSSTGTAYTIATSSTGTGFVNGSIHWVRVTWQASTGNVNFYTSSDGSAWSALGTTQNILPASSIFDGTAALEVGAHTTSGSAAFNGNIYQAQVWSGFSDAGGTLKANFNAADAPTMSSTSWTASTTGETWTLNGTADLAENSATLFTPTAATFNTTAMFQNSTNSTTAFQIQNAANNSNLLIADTVNSRIGLGVVPITTAGSGLLQVGAASSTTAAQGISFGGDTSANLYRLAAGELKTDGRLEANARIVASHLNTAGQVELGAIGPSSNAAILFGTAEDTNLYRSTTATLKTDNSFVVGTLGATGTTVLCENAGLLATCASSIGSGSYIFNQTSLQSSANFAIQSTGTTNVTALIKQNTSQTADLLQFQNSSGNKITGFDSAGKLQFADGAGGAYDTDLRRTASATLVTDGWFEALGGSVLTDTGYFTQSAAATSGDLFLESKVTGDTISRFRAYTSGKLEWGPGGAGARDTNLYRSAAGVLKTDSNLQVGGTSSSGSTTAFQVQNTSGQGILTVDSTNSSVGIGTSGALSTAKLYITTGYADTILASNTSTGNLLRLQNNSTDIVTIGNTGSALFRNSTDSSTAFQIQSTLGTNTLFRVDTSGGGISMGNLAPRTGPGVLSLYGSGTNGAGSQVYFGDGNTTTNQNAWVGERSGDTDQLQLQGKSGVYITTEADASMVVANFFGSGTGATGTAEATFDSRATFGYDGSTSNAIVQGESGKGIHLNVNGTTTAVQIGPSGNVNVGTRYGNRLFSDDFESGNLSLWDQGTTGAVSANGSNGHESKYAALVNPSGSPAYSGATIVANSTVYLRAWVKVTSQTSSAANLLTIGDQNALDGWTVFRDSGGTAKLWNNAPGSGGVLVGSGGSFTTGSWHLIEMAITTGNPTGTSQVWFDGTQIINATGQNNGTTSPALIQIGDADSSRTFTAYIDAVSADTVSNGNAASLGVDDSFHVGGTATFGSSALFQSTSNTGFQIQNSSGGVALAVDTTQNDVGIGTLPVSSTKFAVLSNNFTAIQGKSTGSGDLLDLLNNTATILQVTNGGATTLKTTTNSATGFVIQDNSGNRALDFDTVNNRLGINLTSSGTPGAEFEIHRQDYTARGNNIKLSTANGNDWYIGQSASATYATGNNLTFKSDGTTNNVLTLNSQNGSALFQDSTDNTTAFQIQNQSGASLLTGDTSNTRINVVGDVNVGTSYGNRLFSEDFESGTASKWDSFYSSGSSTSAISSAQAHGGKYSALFTEAGCCAAGYAPLNPYTNTTVYSRAYFYMTSHTSGDAILMQFYDKNTSTQYVALDRDVTTGNLKIFNANTSTFTTSTTQMPLNQWVKLEVKVTTGGSGAFSVWMNDTPIAALTLTGQSISAGTVGIVLFGNENTRTYTEYVDDIAIDAGGQTGTSTNLNVDNSLHVAGTSSFGDSLSVGGNVIANGNATATTGTTSGAGGANVTTITLSAAGSFANNDVIFVDNTGGSGQDYYTRIVSGGGTTTLTVSPAVSYGTAAGYTGNATITKYNVQYLGGDGSNFSGVTRSNKSFFQGYFTGGVVTGTGSTIYSDGNIQSANALKVAASSYLLQNSADSTSALSVQNAAGTNHVLDVNTTNGTVAIDSTAPTSQSLYIWGGTSREGIMVDQDTTSTSALLRLQHNASDVLNVASTGKLSILTAVASTDTPFVIAPSDGTVSSSVYMQINGRARFGYSNGVVILDDNGSDKSFNLNLNGHTAIQVQDTGATTISQATDTTTAFQVQDAAGVNLLAADSYNQILSTGGGVLTAPANGGTTGTWGTSTALGTGCGAGVYGATSVAYNGYIYIMGGSTSGTTATTTVCYATLNAGTGAVGTWTATTNLPLARYNATSVVYNGYVYVLGGTNGTTDQTTVYYAHLDPSTGAVGTWNTATALTAIYASGVELATSVVNNGYVYVMGGSMGGTLENFVSYAKINADGSLGNSWKTATALTAATAGAASVVNNGYIYELGGDTTGNTCSGTNTTNNYYAPLYADGTIGSWNTTTSLTNGRFGAAGVAWGGYVYVLEGNVAGTGCSPSGVPNQALPFNANGTLGAQTGPTSPGTSLFQAPAVTYNGYVYILGGTTDGGTTISTAVQFATVNGNQGTSTSATNLVANGSLTVANANIYGTLQASGDVLFKNSANSSAAFQVQNASGLALLGVNTSSTTVNIGVTGTTATASTVNIANTSGAAIQTVNIGSIASTSATLIQGGTSTNAVGIQVGASGTISIGTTSQTTTIKEGNTSASTTVLINGGTGASAIALTPGVNGSVSLGAATGTGTITLGKSTGAETINIGNVATTAGLTHTINIGATNNATTGVTAINIGNSNTSTGVNTVTIKAGGSGRSQGPSVTLGNVATQSNAVCSSLANNTAPTAGTAYELYDCNVAPAIDYAEYYPTDGTSTYGDIMMLGPQSVQEYDTDGQGNIMYNAPTRTVSKLVKATQAYASNVIGVVSNNYDMFTSTGLGIVSQSDNPMPVALNGRIPVNISPSSAPIAVGDYITTSSDPGKGMKATQAGQVIGKALDSWTPGSGQTQIMVFVEQGYYAGPNAASYVQNGGDASLSNLTVGGNTTLANLGITGATNLSSLNVSGPTTLTSLTVTGDAGVQGTLTVSGNTSIGGSLTVTGLTSVADITINGHVITAGGQPTTQVQTAVGAGAAVAIAGTDTTGTITITTGSNPTAGDLAKILFSKTYGQAPHIVLSASNNNAAGLHFFKGATTATDFMFDALDNPQPNTVYTFDYFIAQ